MQHHRLAIGDRVYAVEPEMEVEWDVGQEPRGELRGPRYMGEVSLSFEACLGVPVLEAEPLPARFEFSCLPESAVVSCADCSGWVLGRPYLPRDAPAIPVEDWSIEVTLVFAAAGFEGKSVKFLAHPGPNRIEVELSPRSLSRGRRSSAVIDGPC